jgi:hypothetical protein
MWAAGASPRQQPRQAAEEHHTAHCAKAAGPLLDVGHRGPEDGCGGEPECAGEAVLAVGAGFESTVVAGQRRRACDHPRQTGDERDGCQRCREDLQLPATAVTALRIHAVAPFDRCTLILASESAAFVSVRIARKSANAATRSADVAEVVERGRHYGWRIEGRTTDTDTDTPRKVYTLRNVGTIDARNVTLTGDYNDLRFADDQSSADVAAGQARLIVVTLMGAARGGEIHIT